MDRFVRPLLLLLPLAGLLGCSPAFRATPEPMPSRVLVEPAGAPSCLVVLLPGIRDAPADFAAEGFGEEVARVAPGARVVAADAHLAYYRKRSVLVRVHADVVAPFLAEHPEADVWVGGVSLGGLGSLLYRRDHADHVSGVVALAPFLGEDDLVAELDAAGGLAGWTPPADPDPTDGAREIWTDLQEELGSAEVLGAPPILLGFGRGDDFAAANRHLARLLPPERVSEVDGGHDWVAWKALWREALASEAFVCGGTG